jgi:hypothetical protein
LSGVQLKDRSDEMVLAADPLTGALRGSST